MKKGSSSKGKSPKRSQKNKILEEDDLNKLRDFFAISASEYWHNAKIGRSAIDILLINSVIPYKYAWAQAHSLPLKQDEAYRLLRQIPAEKNHITERWKMLGVKIDNAADSQTFIPLYQDYCIRHRCLNCEVGYQIFYVQEQSEISA